MHRAHKDTDKLSTTQGEDWGTWNGFCPDGWAVRNLAYRDVEAAYDEHRAASVCGMSLVERI